MNEHRLHQLIQPHSPRHPSSWLPWGGPRIKAHPNRLRASQSCPHFLILLAFSFLLPIFLPANFLRSALICNISQHTLSTRSSKSMKPKRILSRQTGGEWIAILNFIHIAPRINLLAFVVLPQCLPAHWWILTHFQLHPRQTKIPQLRTLIFFIRKIPSPAPFSLPWNPTNIIIWRITSVFVFAMPLTLFISFLPLLPDLFFAVWAVGVRHRT